MVERPPLPSRIRLKPTASQEAKFGYLHFGLQKPSFEALQGSYDAIKDDVSPHGFNVRAAILYDMATSEGQTYDQKTLLFDQCEQVISEGLALFKDRDFQTTVDAVQWLHGGVWHAHLPHMRHAELGSAQWNSREQSRNLLMGLLTYGVEAIKEKPLFKRNGVTFFQDLQSKVGMQLLVARYNMQHENTQVSMSLISMREGYDAMRKGSPWVTWDIKLVKPQSGEDQPTKHLLRILHDNDRATYDPSITVVCTKNDLGISTPTEILKYTALENFVGTDTKKAVATHKLDEYTKLLFDKVGIPT